MIPTIYFIAKLLLLLITVAGVVLFVREFLFVLKKEKKARLIKNTSNAAGGHTSISKKQVERFNVVDLKNTEAEHEMQIDIILKALRSTTEELTRMKENTIISSEKPAVKEILYFPWEELVDSGDTYGAVLADNSSLLTWSKRLKREAIYDLNSVNLSILKDKYNVQANGEIVYPILDRQEIYTPNCLPNIYRHGKVFQGNL